MLRILHLSDFHLSSKTLKDWKDFYKAAFFEKINEINNLDSIDLIAFTGDLIDKGGKDFGNATAAFIEFEKHIIKPILEELSLGIERFIICPGNHDIERDADTIIDENGLKSTLKTSDDIIEFISSSEISGTYQYLQRFKKYKEFEFRLYEDLTIERIQTMFKFSLKLDIRGKSVGISSINSSWRCYANDFNNILIGENQLNDNYKFIENCEIKIALMHHQLDWISEIEKRTINSHINKNYDVVLSGHVHESFSQSLSSFTGSCFHNISPSGLNHIRTDNINFVNGFTVIDYNDSITCSFFKYNHSQKKFVDNTDIVDKGRIVFSKPVKVTDIDSNILKEAIKNIVEDQYEIMKNHFIKGKNEDVEIDVKTSFVYPPIDDGKSVYDEEESITTFKDIVNSKEHFLFLGPQECGKRSLLYRLIVEYIEDFEIYNKIPIFIDFYEIKNKEFVTIIKEYTRLNSEKVKDLLIKGKFILLIDNLNYHESKNFGVQINKLHRFVKENSLIRIIGTYEHDHIKILPSEIISHCKIPFYYHYIRALKTKEIKKIMSQWLPVNDVLKNEESLEKLVKTFTSYHLPSNALSVHLYLWSLENTDKKPINQAVLMEIYIEIILEKISKQNIYRSNFDFTNKVQLISMVAETIIKKEGLDNSLSYAEFYSTIYKYLTEKVGFTFDVNVIIEYLLERKIFSKNNQNEVRFSHICFLHFFVAKRMQANLDFKNFILNESRYFNYAKEIDYYTGLVRSDKETLLLLYQRFKELFDPMDFILNNVNPDVYFKKVILRNKDNEEIEPIARNIEIAKIKDNRPSDEIIERQYDEQLNKISTQKSEIKGKKNVDFDTMMLIMCNVLRNSEGVEDLGLKNRVYNDIIKHNLTYSILYTQVIIRYVVEYNKLPPSIPINISLEDIIENIPYHIQHSLFSHLGSKKLDSIILTKIKKDINGNSNSNSEIEKFLSVTLYSDVFGQDFDIYLREFVKSVKTIPVQNYLFYKLMGYLYKRSKKDSNNEKMYLDLIADLQIRSQKLPKRLKLSFIKNLKDKKNSITRGFRFE